MRLESYAQNDQNKLTGELQELGIELLPKFESAKIELAETIRAKDRAQKLSRERKRLADEQKIQKKKAQDLLSRNVTTIYTTFDTALHQPTISDQNWIKALHELEHMKKELLRAYAAGIASKEAYNQYKKAYNALDEWLKIFQRKIGESKTQEARSQLERIDGELVPVWYMIGFE